MSTSEARDQRLILIVEDDPDIAHWMETKIKEAGLAAAVVDNGESALDWLSGRRPDLVLTGVMMPRLDGFELTRRITAEPDAPPVVICSAKGLQSDRDQGFAAGAVDWISKVEEMDQLVPRIMSVLNS